jgi:hypothetical protein
LTIYTSKITSSSFNFVTIDGTNSNKRKKSYVVEWKVKKAVQENNVENREKRIHTGEKLERNTNIQGRE